MNLNPPTKPAFDRREFLITVAGVGFALTAQPIMAQTAITTDSKGLVAGEVKIPVADGTLTGYRAQPAIGKHFPVVLVVSEIFGVQNGSPTSAVASPNSAIWRLHRICLPATATRASCRTSGRF